jgi:predicted secreted hydrolase
VTARGWAAAAGVLLVAVTLGVAAWSLGRREGGERVRATLSAVSALAADDTAGYERPRAGRALRFPEDHAAHPTFRNEWWYLTGNLRAGGRRIGYQLVVFRGALSPRAPEGESAWSTNQGWMAHLALTDPRGSGFREHERFSRGALGLAGAEGSPLRVWVEDWEVGGGADGAFPVTLTAADSAISLHLRFEPLKPATLHGVDGFHVKDPDGTSASHYYSLTRLRTTGTVTIAGEALAVDGLSWLDREWSTGGLPAGVQGWDWMGLQLDDGRDLMLYRLRGSGGESAGAGGTLVSEDGTTRTLSADEVALEVLERWRSPLDDTDYPSAWRIRVPSAGLDLEVRPILPEQELNLSYRYWEGAVDVRSAGGGEISGWGYLEMTGYGGEDVPPGAPGRPADGGSPRGVSARP